jgi:hypothetical protein
MFFPVEPNPILGRNSTRNLLGMTYMIVHVYVCMRVYSDTHG